MHDPGTDPLSPLARKIVDAGSYRELVVNAEPATARELLENVTPDQLLAVPIKDPVAAYALLAALWLRHDALYSAHEIVQKSPEKLLSVAPFVHQTPEKTSLKVHLVKSVENRNAITSQRLREDEMSLSFWHAIMHRCASPFRIILKPYQTAANQLRL